MYGRYRCGATAWLALLSAFFLQGSSLPAQSVPDGLVVGGDHEYPPYEWLGEGGSAQGFHVDLLRALGDQLGLEVEFRYGPWADVYRAFATGEIDVLPMFYSESRAEAFAFTQPYQVLPHEIFMSEGGAALRSLDGLGNAAVAVQDGALIEAHLVGEVDGVRLLPAPTEDAALRMLAGGAADYAVVTQLGAQMARLRPGLERIVSTGPPVLAGRYALAVAGERTSLRDALDAGLASLKSDGRFMELQDRWLGFPPARPTSMPYLLVGLAVALGLMVLAAIWGWSLKLRVKTATARLERDLRERREAEARYVQQAAAVAESQNQLERFNRLALGRESRVVELKHEINRLARELGRPPPYGSTDEAVEGGP